MTRTATDGGLVVEDLHRFSAAELAAVPGPELEQLAALALNEGDGAAAYRAGQEAGRRSAA